MKAFVGTGLLGANFVKAMLRRGDQVQVWNRTASKAKALETDGAKAFENIIDAVRGAKLIHLTLKDDAAVNEVLAAASSGFEPGVTIIDHTTTSADGAVERTAKWKAMGFTYLHAPVFMGPPNALESSGNMLVSGDQQVIKSVEAELAKMTGKLINFGSEEGKAAGIKLIGNLFLISMTAGLSDALALAKALSIDAANIAELFASWNPGAGAPARLDKLRAGEFSKPSWELDMARKDAGLMMDAASEKGIKLTVLPAVAAEMDNWIAKGHGTDDWSVIAKNNL
ncbi:NAD(P)-dependent oxidoreductase [Pedobacter frigiditerrae]|uniref:NAD(P)-dependent oxidoreductase n=1 Tax=Pedobacter frigiditerrae TaxID=2530452 RepID=A0A4R0MQF9_9SPHI|nr:NAD(P)-dependent oxidoreductase [Pedobacter frigiditerrae]TCC88502.1 NAD(P)-dependent oxidoreductase [Pedobacter frigiditerrae]